MTRISRSALVSHSPQQMFELVCDVCRYPEFLPWVEAAEEYERDAERQLASLSVRIAGIRQRFTTENRLRCPEALDMRLVSGSFEQLTGGWRFQAIGDLGTRVSLDLSFELPNSLLLLPFRRGFGKVADRMVDDFCRRADQIHG